MHKHTLDHSFDKKKSLNNKQKGSFPFGKIEIYLIYNGLKVNKFGLAIKYMSTRGKEDELYRIPSWSQSYNAFEWSLI